LTYYYVVTAVNSEGESSKSNEAKVRVSATKYLIVEVYDNMTGTYSRINEIEVYDNEERKINYNAVTAFDSVKNGLPNYWNNSDYGKHKLNDGDYTNYAIVNYKSSSGWTRMVLELQDNNGISKVDVWTHSADKPRQVNIYETTNYDYNTNIKERNNKGITYFGSVDINNNKIDEKYTVLPQLPYPPSRINIEEKDRQVSIVWNSISNASSYKVKRATRSGGPYTTIVENLKQTGFVDNTVINNTQYFYVITSVNGAGESNNSDEISATPNVVKPIAPINLKGKPSDAKVNLSWNLVNNADTYNLKRSEASGGPYTTVAEDITATSYEDTGLVNGNTYYYVISAKNEAGESQYSSEFSVRAGAIILNPPTNVKGVPGDQKVMLSWNTSNHATGYKVKRAATSGGPYVDIAGNIINNSFVDTNLINNTTYYYIIVAINDTEQSGFSSELSATPGVFIPEQVLNFVGVADDNQVALSWDVNDKADTYTLKRALTPTGPFTIIAQGLTGTSYIDTSAVNNTSYYYIVSGVNKAGESPNSVVVLVIPKAKAGKRVILALTMTNGMQKDYDLSQTQLVEFLNWYRKAGKDQGMPYFTIIKGEDKGPYLSKRDYIIFEKILYFEINEFTK
jgi:fibronectin type 3 domain-containing protein